VKAGHLARSPVMAAPPRIGSGSVELAQVAIHALADLGGGRGALAMGVQPTSVRAVAARRADGSEQGAAQCAGCASGAVHGRVERHLAAGAALVMAPYPTADVARPQPTWARAEVLMLPQRNEWTAAAHAFRMSILQQQLGHASGASDCSAWRFPACASRERYDRPGTAPRASTS
jgi:hypothetical protein